MHQPNQILILDMFFSTLRHFVWLKLIKKFLFLNFA